VDNVHGAWTTGQRHGALVHTGDFRHGNLTREHLEEEGGARILTVVMDGSVVRLGDNDGLRRRYEIQRESG
jgi:hypothetical protein